MGRSVGCRAGKVVALIDDPRDFASDDLLILPLPDAVAGSFTDAELIERLGVVAGAVVDLKAPKPKASLRIAMVGAWGIPCGIATFAEALWPEVGALAKDWLVFAERDDAVKDGPNVKAGLWRRGESLIPLAKALHEWKPDVVFIQHEYGLFPDARHWLAFMGAIHSLRPIVTLHSIYAHADKTICEAAIPEIVCHSALAAKVLKGKGVSAKISVIPHGCGPVASTRLYNLYKTPHRFMQFGFGFRYKNWEASIGATAILKKTLPDIFFTGLFSEGKFSKAEHDRYHGELMALARSEGVEEHIALIRGYQSEAAIDSYLGTNSVACFPYKNDPGHVVYGASGAARRAMQAGIPVVVSKVPHFADMGAACLQAETAKDLAEAIASLMTDQEARKAALSRQLAFMRANSWALAAKAYVDLI